ncbi:MAG: PD40 domain-containing protein [Myxococcales bacterium]|nr:PD40 domain-containing protein [Myxococcales bacterium]
MTTRFNIAVAGLVLGTTAAQADVSTPRQVADRPSAHCQAPRWSPDGLHLAIDIYEPKKELRETWIVKFSEDGRKVGEAKVTAGRASAAARLGAKAPPVVEFAWAPDMKLLSKPYVFSSRGPKKNFDLFADGAWLTTNPGNDGQPAWSPDGRFIAFTSQQTDSGDIMLIDLGGESDKPLQVTSWPTMTEYGPRWAPGKSALLFTRSQTGNRGQDIGVVLDVKRARETTKMVTEWGGDEIRPSWSPDGTAVAFYANKGNENDKQFDLYVVNLDGSDPRRLARDVVVDDHEGPVWTPDGTTLLYVKKDFKADNPVMWVRRDESAKGTLDTGTQLNSDLSLYNAGGQLKLAFKALGQRGSTEKTWERVYVVGFTMGDLK